jgi:hypothetical protein
MIAPRATGAYLTVRSMAGNEPTYRLSVAALEALERSGWIERYRGARQRFIDQSHTERGMRGPLVRCGQ